MSGQALLEIALGLLAAGVWIGWDIYTDKRVRRLRAEVEELRERVATSTTACTTG